DKRVEIVFTDDADRYIKLLEEIDEIKNIQSDKNKATLVIEKPEISNPIIIKNWLIAALRSFILMK
ncbi:unnamed protein product, partial [marine sediment metagenome]